MADRPLHSLSDDELLARLGSAMSAEQLEPTGAALDEVRMMLVLRASLNFFMSFHGLSPSIASLLSDC